jgi:hypothetical protein
MSGKARLMMCRLCYNKGIVRARNSQEWVRCICGKMLSSTAELTLSRQEQLKRRLEDVKKGQW